MQRCVPVPYHISACLRCGTKSMFCGQSVSKKVYSESSFYTSPTSDYTMCMTIETSGTNQVEGVVHKGESTQDIPSFEERLDVLKDMFMSNVPVLVGERPYSEEYKNCALKLWEKEGRPTAVLELKEWDESVRASYCIPVAPDAVPSSDENLLLESDARKIINGIITKYKNHGGVSPATHIASYGINPDTAEPYEASPHEHMSSREEIEKLCEHFDAHGISKSDYHTMFTSLVSLLRDGVDYTRTFYSAPFDITSEKRAGLGAGLGTAGGTAVKDGLAVVTAGYDEKFCAENQTKIKHVFINDVFVDLVPVLEKMFPQVAIHRLSEHPVVFKSEEKEVKGS
jgi:hypothetical protein